LPKSYFFKFIYLNIVIQFFVNVFWIRKIFVKLLSRISKFSMKKIQTKISNCFRCSRTTTIWYFNCNMTVGLKIHMELMYPSEYLYNFCSFFRFILSSRKTRFLTYDLTTIIMIIIVSYINVQTITWNWEPRDAIKTKPRTKWLIKQNLQFREKERERELWTFHLSQNIIIS